MAGKKEDTPPKVEMRGIADIIPYENNPRYNEDAVEAVMSSIRTFGFKVPIVVDKDGVVVAGHTRLKAAKRLGMRKVPCLVADDLTEEQVKAYRLADNKVAEFSYWLDDKLKEELDGITGIDMGEFGFDADFDIPGGGDGGDGDESADIDAKTIFVVEVHCADEQSQKDTYDRLVKEGLECRLLTL